MKQSKIIKFLFIACLIGVIVGAVLFYAQGWSFKKQLASLINFVSESDEPGSMSLAQLIWQAGGFEEEKNYLVLFQNNLELRPSGGYIGNFGFLKIANGQVKYLASHDSTIYDGYGQTQTDPPQPFKTYLGLDNWQTRDGNWSPDFAISAQQVEELYWKVGGLDDGAEEFDGVIAINASLLPKLLEYTGPVYLDKYEMTFTADNVLYDLEYEVEKGYVRRNLEEGNRKAMFKDLLEEVTKKLTKKNIWQINKAKDLIISQLDQKNILVYFKDQKLQQEASRRGWTGQVYQEVPSDYLMLVEANLGARKSNYFVDRSIDYSVDLDQEKPVVTLKITYSHRGQKNDWFNHDYLCYLRIYTPAESWLMDSDGFNSQVDFTNDLNKKVFGYWLVVPTNTKKTVTIKYQLPSSIKDNPYQLLVQKQPGVDQIPIKVQIISNGETFLKESLITQDWQEAILIKQ